MHTINKNRKIKYQDGLKEETYVKSQKQLFLQGCNTGQTESLAFHISSNP
jgi:hypothetical protein